jgi:hypothetical protein
MLPFLRPAVNGTPREIRTPDPNVRSVVLYPSELWAPLIIRRSLHQEGEVVSIPVEWNEDPSFCQTHPVLLDV